MKINRESFLKILEAVQPGLSTRESIEQSTCFTGDTIIHTLGGDFTAADLFNREVTEFKVFSVAEGDQLRMGSATNLRKTRSNAPVYRVSFDTGESIKLTLDHLMMMRDGSFRAVRDVQVGDSVMPFNYRYTQDGYRVIWSGVSKSRVRACRWAYEQVHGEIVHLPYHIHHKDFNESNDDPSNLQKMTNTEHARIHCSKNGPPSRQPGASEKLSAAAIGNKRGSGPKPGTSAAMKGKQHALGCRGNRTPRTPKQIEASRKNIKFAIIAAAAKKKGLKNHKVVSIDYVGKEDVYDLSVAVYHNFAASGVFIHNCFIFTDGKVQALNDEIAAHGPTPFDSTIRGAVRANKLLEILRKLPEDELDVGIEQGQLSIVGKRRKTGITMEAEIHHPLVGSVEEPTSWIPLHKDFSEAVGVVGLCAASDQSVFARVCVHLTPKWVEAHDGVQACRWKLPTGFTGEKKESGEWSGTLVRQASIKHIVALNMTEFSETAHWLHFRNSDKVVLSCRRYVEDYPEDSNGEFKSDEGLAVVLPKGLIDAADNASVFSSENVDSNVVKVEMTSGTIRLRGDGISGYHRESKKIAYDGEPVSFLISPKLLADIVKRHSEVKIAPNRLRVNGGAYRYMACLFNPQSLKKENKVDESDESVIE